MLKYLLVFLLTVGALGVVAPASAQPDEGTMLAAGETAPDFELPGGTRYGLLQDQVRLSDYRGKTVVLAFFYRVRTPG